MGAGALDARWRFPDQFNNNNTAGDRIPDGATITVTAHGVSVTFEFEDIAGDDLPAGSDTDGGNGWTPGNVPIFYRRSDGYLLIRGLGYSQQEMVYAIREAINSSILVTNGIIPLVEARAGYSRSLGDNILGADPALYITNVSSIVASPALFEVNRRTPLGDAAQPFGRIINNTVYGSDGNESFFAGTALLEAKRHD